LCEKNRSIEKKGVLHMNKEALQQARTWVRSELELCVDFWLKHGMDPVNGGVYTCLDREGNLYSTDKSVWMQGRCAWTFSYLCHVYGKKQEWLDAARSCLDFMEAHCTNREAGNRMYFTVTADGKPLRQRRYCFSEGFYAIACAEYYGQTAEKEYLERARKAYQLVYDLNHGAPDPTGMGPKTIPETRTGRALGNPMIFLNMTNVLRRLDPEQSDLYDRYAQECVHDIFAYHFKPEMKCTLETVGVNGEFWKDITDGRFVNPGHDIECSWFLMEEANRTDDAELHTKAELMFRYAIEAGWDKEYGGLLYFIDCLGMPPQAYEHDMKLWWPHNEILIASLMAYRDTKDEYFLNWFEKTLDYCKTYFADDQYGEWYGYLRRDGKPTMPPCKGSTFKGPFHVPRSLIMADQLLGEILAE
jgi:N-acylglucosamine 2-epimerase